MLYVLCVLSASWFCCVSFVCECWLCWVLCIVCVACVVFVVGVFCVRCMCVLCAVCSVCVLYIRGSFKTREDMSTRVHGVRPPKLAG